MSLLTLLIFGGTAVLYTTLLPAKWREWALLAASIIVLYWLQPFNPIRFSGYILPTLTIGLVVMGWWVTQNQPPGGSEPPGGLAQRLKKEDRTTLFVIAGLVLAISFLRFLPQELRPIANRPPSPVWVTAGLVGLGTAVTLVARFGKSRQNDLANRSTKIAILLIIGLFAILKTEVLATAVAHLWRNLTNQDTSLASAADLTWLGFSYVAFRLLHTLRDRQTGQLPAMTLREYATYVLFFPAITAGPIDRAERFVTDLRALSQMVGLDAARFADGLTRIGIGLFKKFVIADSLALGMSLDGVDVTLVQSPGRLWLLLYGYAFRLFFDFSGYSDIAIGLGLLFGVRLPENFRRPYRQTSLTAFWQSWHITLSDWARFYVFTPLSRKLLRRKPRPSPTLIVLSAQLATMVTIGLWHGVGGNFLIWGLWHGAGLFIHKQWSDRTRKWYRGLAEKPAQKWAWTPALSKVAVAVSWFLTFHYVVIGWVWFVLPDPALAAQTILKLFGGG
ncbi:MAG: MBOAT family protein [Ardenticatenaceae bacterium]|nr:MBOAT family protein [Ardenticatenaceae bacterium]